MSPTGPDPPNPYIGPRPFERADAESFFARADETLELTSLVVASRVVLLYAASGAGKTSLLNAGLTPRLEQEGFEVRPARLVAGLSESTLKSSRNVFDASLVGGWGGDGATLAEHLAASPHPLGADGLVAPRAILFDQFEELFTLYPAYWSQQRGFVGEIAEALEEDPLLRVVLALREDYVARLDPLAELLPDALETRYRLELLGRDQALDAVRSPAERRGVTYAPDVAERLVANLMLLHVDTGRGEAEQVPGPAVEPVHLQVICQRVWHDLPPGAREITREHVRASGDVDRVLGSFYDAAVRGAARAGRVREKRLRRWIERSLITSVGTRGTVHRSAEATGGIEDAAIAALEDSHLLRSEWRAGASWCELTHDRLIEPIRASNARFRARARVRRAVAGGAVVALLVVVAAVALLAGGSGEPAAGLTTVDARLSVDVTYNITLSDYLDKTHQSREALSEEQLARVGNQLGVVVTTTGLRGRRLDVIAGTFDVESGTLLNRPPAARGVARPTADLDTTLVNLWSEQPVRGGKYRYSVSVEAAGFELATAASATFRLTGKRSFDAPTPTPTPTPTRLSPLLARVLVEISGDGSVTVTPPGVVCPPTCSFGAASGSLVELEAVPASDAVFVEWGGSCRGARSRCFLRVSVPTRVRAVFTPRITRTPVATTPP